VTSLSTGKPVLRDVAAHHQPQNIRIREVLVKSGSRSTSSEVALCCRVVVWPRPATKGHAVTVSPLPQLGWGVEWEQKGKTRGSG